jgi:hypothetical protein
MVKSLLAMAFALLSLQASANTNEIAVAAADSLARSWAQNVPLNTLLLLKVGDSADYKMDGGFIQGTMHNLVREETPQGFWVQQDMDMGFLGKQKVEILFDKSTAGVLELLVNGQKQTPPDPNDVEIVETKHDHITVPKGEYDCIYAKIHDKKQNQDSEAWVNPKVVPINGMLKTIAPSQLGTITMELTDFVRN